MKKIFTLAAGILFATALLAADRRPVVKVNSSKHYKIVLDGRAYFGSDMTISLDRFQGNRHTIKVYEMKKGYYGNRERLVGSTTFRTDRNDVIINIDWFGNISIREMKNYRRYGNHDRNDRFPDNRGNRF